MTAVFTEIEIKAVFESLQKVTGIIVREIGSDLYRISNVSGPLTFTFTLKRDTNLILSPIASQRFFDVYTLLQGIYGACRLNCPTDIGRKVFYQYKLKLQALRLQALLKQ